jgi:hypothetical protein
MMNTLSPQSYYASDKGNMVIDTSKPNDISDLASTYLFCRDTKGAMGC